MSDQGIPVVPMADATKIFDVPVLIGGPGAGQSFDGDWWRVLKLPTPEGLTLYREAKCAAPNGTWTLRFMAWEELGEEQALALAFDWVLSRLERLVHARVES